MKNQIKTGIIAFACVAIITAIASPNTVKKFGRGVASVFVNEANSIYSNNLIVDDMKTQYLNGCETLINLRKQLVDAKAQKNVFIATTNSLEKEISAIRVNIKSIDIKNAEDLNKAKNLKTKYETLKSKLEYCYKQIISYDSIISKLNVLIVKTEAECEKLHCKIEETQSNIQMLRNMKNINTMMQNNIEEFSMNEFDVSEIQNELLKETSKFEVISEEASANDSQNLNKEEIEKFIESI